MSKNTRQVRLDLVGLDGNAFALLASFRQQAKREQWSDEEIQGVIDEAMKGDYDHLLRTLIKHCTPTR